MQEQQKQIEELTNRLNNLQNGGNIDPAVTPANKEDQPSLGQNIPNPFNAATTIKYHLVNMNNNASILLFDMSGTLMKTYKLNDGNKDSELQISAGELKAGMYYYSLVIDEKEIDTKKMILTK